MKKGRIEEMKERRTDGRKRGREEDGRDEGRIFLYTLEQTTPDGRPNSDDLRKREVGKVGEGRTRKEEI